MKMVRHSDLGLIINERLSDYSGCGGIVQGKDQEAGQ